MSIVQNEHEYEELLSLWADLEAGLGIILNSPNSVLEFEQRVYQYDRWMQSLLARDTDVGLYLLFQLSTQSSVGYSTSHALICAVLCHLIAQELSLATPERDRLTYAALTMNIAITNLQDQLALQTDKLSPEQQTTVRRRAADGSALLATLGVSDELWLNIVSFDNDSAKDQPSLIDLPPHQRLARILRTVDRYAAMISPRKSREGRSAEDSARSLIKGSASDKDEVGHALVQVVGLSPPGTCVRLDDGTTAIVIRRSSQAKRPHVAIVADASGQLLHEPQLHSTERGKPDIQSALPNSTVRLQLNHHLILQLGAQAN
jgi:HD-GYP domain-containing protein (c-di-GMP phosphodiesterase class II)